VPRFRPAREFLLAGMFLACRGLTLGGVVPEPVNLKAWRAQARWSIVETRFFVAHLDENIETSDVSELVRVLDDLHVGVCSALAVDTGSRKRQESVGRRNPWVYDPAVLFVPGAAIRDTRPKIFYGTADSSGVHMSLKGLSWSDSHVLDRVTHEDAHVVWGATAGEAPALLNEGIAAMKSALKSFATMSTRSTSRLYTGYF
jgi:hypothetical protein